MANKTRAQLQATIDANLPDNTTELITPVLHREVETDLKDSNFNKLDDTAFDVNYTPTTSADWDVTIPTNDGDGLDQLASRMRILESIGVSLTTAFVDPNGDDGTGEVGVITKPFASFAGAKAALPSSNFRIVSLGGTFNNSDFDISLCNNFIIDLRGTTINTIGNGVRLLNCNKASIILEGGIINGNVNIGGAGSTNINVQGGEINGILNLGEQCFVNKCRITSSTYAITSEITDLTQRAYLSDCRITGTGTNATIGQSVCSFSNCFIQGLNKIYEPFSNNTRYCKFSNCTLIASGSSNAAIFGANGIINGIFKQCRIQATAGTAIWIGSTSSDFTFFEDCDIIAETNCVFIQSTLNRPSTTRTTFKRCSFYTNTGEIFTGSPDVADLGKTSLIGTTLTNKTLLALTNFEVIGDQLTVTDAQIPTF